ncbi:phosphoribosylaminoimidazole carboxylase [Paramyrothecium foliicola]|nr:phosphoribosylaminoimidazole carboxylase [Paramyrothecium foliicola]
MVKNQVIGVLGGGQLARMLQEQAMLLGVELVVLDQAGCPVHQINQNDKHVIGSFRDPVKIRELAKKVDILTIEIEHIDTQVLEEIATVGVDIGGGQMKKVPVHPSWETLRLIQDKYLQKEHFHKEGIPVAPQMKINSGDAMLSSLQEAGQAYGFPFMLKARTESYDGRGNYKVNSAQDFEDAISAMGQLPLYAEKFQPFQKELAVMVVRTETDAGELRDVFAYPAVETVHVDSICATVFYPPRQVPDDICEAARKTASNVIRTLKGRGVFAVEMFLLENGQLVINEVAPRPHNSGHYTIEAVPFMSQYRAQLYSILDILPPSLQLKPRVSSAIMVNILGGAQEKSHDSLVDLTYSLPQESMDVFLHLYGKSSKPGRKIGHITATSYSSDVDLEQLAAPLINEADSIRQERVNAKSADMRPTASSSQPSAVVSGSTSSRDTENPLVVITMGSDSDLHVLRGAFEVLERFRVPYDFTITSAHRTPHLMSELAKSAADRGIRVLIAAAGGAAALPGMLASETPIPVIGVPVKATHLDGNDSLLSIVQMPRGCPVATVGINNSTNAGMLAVRILGTGDAKYRKAMADYMQQMCDEVEVKAAKLREIGWEAYLKNEPWLQLDWEDERGKDEEACDTCPASDVKDEMNLAVE